jgi:hypothetical protein
MPNTITLSGKIKIKRILLYEIELIFLYMFEIVLLYKNELNLDFTW